VADINCSSGLASYPPGSAAPTAAGRASIAILLDGQTQNCGIQRLGYICAGKPMPGCQRIIRHQPANTGRPDRYHGGTSTSPGAAFEQAKYLSRLRMRTLSSFGDTASLPQAQPEAPRPRVLANHVDSAAAGHVPRTQWIMPAVRPGGPLRREPTIRATIGRLGCTHQL